MNKKLSEVELIKFIDGHTLEMGLRGGDRLRDRDGERGRDSDRQRDTDNIADRLIEIEELSGDIIDLYNTNPIFGDE